MMGGKRFELGMKVQQHTILIKMYYLRADCPGILPHEGGVQVSFKRVESENYLVNGLCTVFGAGNGDGGY